MSYLAFWSFSVQNSIEMGSANTQQGSMLQWYLWEQGDSGQTIQLYLQPHIVVKEYIFLVLVQTCHSLVLAGVIRCNWITGSWRMTDACFIDGLYSELVRLSFSKAQDRVSAVSHWLVIAWDPVLWPSHTPEMKHSPWSSFMVFPQHDHELFLLEDDEHGDLSI